MIGGYRVKTCNKCNIEKDYNEFNKDSSKADGYYNICKECRKATSKVYYMKNKANISNKKRIYYKTHKNILLPKIKAYIEANKDAIREQKKEYYIKNIESIRIKKKQYYQLKKFKEA